MFRIWNSYGNKLEEENMTLEKQQNSKKPWINPDGTTKSDEEIRSLCGNSEEMWDQYLTESIESDLGRDEIILEQALDIEREFSYQDKLGDLINHLQQEEGHHKAQLVRESILKHLSRRERQAVQLVYLEGKTQEEVSEILGVKRRSVRSYLNRGLEKIAKLAEAKTELSKINNYFEVLFRNASSHISNFVEDRHGHLNRLPRRKERTND